MSHIMDDLPDQHNSPLVSWSGFFAANIADFATKAQIVIPSLDENLRWENCLWMARNDVDLPQRGDKCLAIFDENNQIWIPVWWPF